MSKPIQDYHTLKESTIEYAFTKDFKKTKIDDRTFFGIEVEMSFDRGASSTASDFTIDEDLGKMFVFERDGSVSNGFEMITRPMTYLGLMNFFDIPEIKSLVESSEPRSNNGIHIHFSRPLTDEKDKEMTQKLIAFFTRFSNRLSSLTRSSSYARWYSGQSEDDWLGALYFSLMKMKKDGSYYNFSRVAQDGFPRESELRQYIERLFGERYMCVNFNNRKTYELRFFPTTNKVSKIQNFIKFTKAMIDLFEEKPLEYILLADFTFNSDLSFTHAYNGKKIDFVYSATNYTKVYKDYIKATNTGYLVGYEATQPKESEIIAWRMDVLKGYIDWQTKIANDENFFKVGSTYAIDLDLLTHKLSSVKGLIGSGVTTIITACPFATIEELPTIELDDRGNAYGWILMKSLQATGRANRFRLPIGALLGEVSDDLFRVVTNVIQYTEVAPLSATVSEE